jgi:O-antigen chain-terminating methyltransferase
MAEAQGIDVERIIEHTRERIRKRQQEMMPSDLSIPTVDSQVLSDLSLLHDNYDVYNFLFTSHRWVLGKFVVCAKNALRKLLTPLLTRQVTYNASNARIVTHVMEQLGHLMRQQQLLLEDVRASQAALEEQLAQVRAAQVQSQAALEERLTQVRAAQVQGQAALEEQLTQVRAELLAALEERLIQVVASQTQALQEQHRVLERMQSEVLQGMQGRLSMAERKLRRLIHMLMTPQEEGKTAHVELQRLPHHSLEPDFDYFGFEERFRGSEQDIKERQRVYLEYFQRQENILDIGCGRGEFLELLRKAGIKALGVDTDLDMVLYCREKGLDIVEEDAFVYLETLPDASLGGIFAAQLIEHLEPGRVIELVKLCYRKLRSGGVLILETPNPTCLMVFAASFYMDFSHIRPLHPEAMRFLLASAGFQDIELKYAGPVDDTRRLPSLPDIGLPGETMETFRRGVERLNDLLYGYQDYAVIGKKFSALQAPR